MAADPTPRAGAERSLADRLDEAVKRIPWWLRVVLGLLVAALGAWLTLRPSSSLSALVLLIVVGALAQVVVTLSLLSTSAHRSLTVLAAAAWFSLAVVLVAWPAVTTRGLAIAVGAGLLIAGGADIAAALRGTRPDRFAGVLLGLASVILGLVALGWPDTTLLVVAVVFGVRLLFGGVGFAWDAWRARSGPRPDVAPRRPGLIHSLVAVGALVGALLLGSISVTLNRGQPVVDAFYTAPEEAPAEPGRLLRAEPFTTAIPDGASAWRILYTTTRDDGVPAVASGLVVAPRAAAAAPAPVVAWAHGTTGFAETCAPSVLPDPFGAGAFFALDRVLDQGWVLVATDYVGLGTRGPHPYLIGQPSGRAVLDSARAVRQLSDLSVGDQTVVWGHSQGGGAALWTGQLAPTYAPELDIVGVAALAPASDLVGLMDNLGNVTGGSIFASFVAAAYAETYPDVNLDDYVRTTARTAVEEAAQRCLAEPAALASVVSSLAGGPVFDTAPTSGAWGERLRENIPTGPIPAPLLIAQGESDSLVVPAVQRAYVDQLCASDQPVDFRTYAGLDHVPLVQPPSPLLDELVTWTDERLAGEPARSTCPAES